MSLMVHPKFMSKCDDISMQMREILIDWLFEVSDNWKMSDYTIHLCIYITDAYIFRTSSLKRKDLQKVGLVGLYIASKIEERYNPTISDLVFICDGAYTAEEMVAMEATMLKSLDYDVMYDTFLICRDRIFADCNKMSKFYMDCVLFNPVLMYENDKYDIVESCVALATSDEKYWSQCMKKLQKFLYRFTESKSSKHVKHYRDIQ